MLTGPDVERVTVLSFPQNDVRNTWSVAIPDDPALAGTVWLARSLVRSSTSPSGGAFTNAVGLRIE